LVIYSLFLYPINLFNFGYLDLIMDIPQILTPSLQKYPKINGAKRIGASPNKPFLFQIAATGLPPLTYHVQNLPSGLSCEEQTGLITGIVKEPGIYNATIFVSNSLGRTERNLSIEIGGRLCLSPPMGWNSWYCWSESIDDEKIRRTAKAMKEKGLISHGFTYINIDDCWQGSRGGKFNAIQGNERFPNMRDLCEYIHSLGLKIGIYSTPWMGTPDGFTGGSSPTPNGDYSSLTIPPEKRLQPNQIYGRIPGCRLCGAKKYGKFPMTDVDTKQWAEWGFDYVKYDWAPYSVSVVSRMAKELKNCGRDIPLSISSSTSIIFAPFWKKLCTLWRTTRDVHDNWKSITTIGFSQQKWRPFVGPGHWADADMLQIGNFGIPNQFVQTLKPTKLTPDEQYTQVSWWVLLSAPLVLSCDIESMDAFTLNLITNDEVLDINQDSLGKPAKCVYRRSGIDIWKKSLDNGDYAIGIFNRTDHTQSVSIPWRSVDFKNTMVIRDVWRQQDLSPMQNIFETSIANHGVHLLRLRKPINNG
jgi:alpha-galactosidase